MNRWRYIPGFDRRSKLRSVSELELSRRLRKATGFFWAACGGIVIAFLVFTALGALKPSQNLAATVVSLLAAIAWLGHAVLVLYRGLPQEPE